jgi:hypothetical protein
MMAGKQIDTATIMGCFALHHAGVVQTAYDGAKTPQEYDLVTF